jgi:hypothetical protein
MHPGGDALSANIVVVTEGASSGLPQSRGSLVIVCIGPESASHGCLLVDKTPISKRSGHNAAPSNFPFNNQQSSLDNRHSGGGMDLVSE